MNTSATHTYKDWDKFPGEKIPSSLTSYPLLFEMLRAGEAIVDIGCGFGKMCFELIEKGYGPVVGFDINADGIRYAQEILLRFPEGAQARCRFERQDALQTRFPEHAFSVGIMQAFLTTLSDPQHRKLACAEAHRILKPGGSLYIADFIQTWHKDRYRQRYEQGLQETGELGTFNVYDDDTGGFLYRAHHYTEHELVYLLLDQGFSVKQLEYHEFTTRSGHAANGAVIWAVKK